MRAQPVSAASWLCIITFQQNMQMFVFQLLLGQVELLNPSQVTKGAMLSMQGGVFPAATVPLQLLLHKPTPCVSTRKLQHVASVYVETVVDAV